ncbi:GTP pyrophosphokinase [Pseudoduganella violacea]|uniref:PpGpp synthetase/RelA/SpoT-type nucleotidyltransferase n=1 Tax=Pseudoduganella violacea TaxID=1715466 RepID=A0A7W5BG17_9BURK|nr:RelA/SpoT domain-containing protein [Pseudoduganella violacea]MBB3122458.1 ppGpp synthetase/RelA/SpoT-type nucleotidyltransferase [Pseudoduganella violacea]
MENSRVPTDVVADFIARYRREFDFYEQAGKLVAQKLEATLESSGIRAMVTSRAKNPKRLEAKVRQRNGERDQPYQSVEDIFTDIVDLAGVRIALYFPGERDEVDKIVNEDFHLTEIPKIFTGTTKPTDQKRFSGYWATHYRLRLREDSLSEQTSRFAEARVEVQVASVLMHAWSEVEHDLVYKPMQGSLSVDELAILDELNGMVLTGEIALERLQRAAKARVLSAGAKFENHYDLASFLLEFGKSRLQNDEKDPVVGDVEVLYKLLCSLDLSAPAALTPYLESLTADTESRPLSQQIVDQIVAAHPDRYAKYAEIRSDSSISDVTEISTQLPHAIEAHSAMGYFMSQWILFERFVNELAVSRKLKDRPAMVPNLGLVEGLALVSDEEASQIERIRRIRNEVVHGIFNRPPAILREEGDALARILARVRINADPEVAAAMANATDAQSQMTFPDIVHSTDVKHKRQVVSEDALTLLKAAATAQGEILKLAFLSGRSIQIGNRQFGIENPKEASRWEAALNELLVAKLIEVRGHKGEIFLLTHAGWKLAEVQ